MVSSARKPISYINLSKRFLQEHGEVQLSALGIAIAPMVTVAEILKKRGFAVEKRIATSMETLSDQYRTRDKPKMEVILSKSAEFDQIIREENEVQSLKDNLQAAHIADGGTAILADEEGQEACKLEGAAIS